MATKKKQQETIAIAVRDPSPQLSTAASQFAVWQSIDRLKDVEQYTQLGAALTAAKGVRKQLKSELDAIVKPINAGVKALRERYNAVDGPLEAFEGRAKALLNNYERVLREAEIAKAEKAAKAAEKKGDAQFAADLRNQALVKPVAPAIAGQTVVRMKKARITDPMIFLSAVARNEVLPEVTGAMLEVAEQKLSALARAGGTMPDGVIVIEEDVRRVGT